jgi:RNA polymerase sigma-70 factor (ECF subfamily)
MNQGATDFDSLVRAHWHEVNSMLMAITHNQATADDLTQELFVLAHRKQIHPGPGLRTWFRRVARYLALNEMRRLRPLPLPTPEITAIADRVPAPPGAPEETPFTDELGALRLCLQELPDKDRSLLTRRYETRTPLDQIAADERQSPGYIKQRLHRLRRRLADCIHKRLESGGLHAVP